MGKQAAATVQLAVAATALAFVPAVRAESGTSCPGANLRPNADNLPRVEAAMVCLLNVERKREGRVPVGRDRRLKRSARRHTGDMIARGFFAHERRGGPTVLERIRAARYFEGARSGLYSENLGYAPPERASASNMTAAFAFSDSHRRTMLYGRFRDVGVAAALVDPHPAFYPDYPAVVFTLDFGRRYERRRPRCRRRATSAQGGQGGAALPPRRWCRRRSSA